jgi:hypothetical protein
MPHCDNVVTKKGWEGVNDDIMNLNIIHITSIERGKRSQPSYSLSLDIFKCTKYESYINIKITFFSLHNIKQLTPTKIHTPQYLIHPITHYFPSY